MLEPPCLVHLSDDELKELVDNRGEPPDLCVHSQAVERAVKLTSGNLIFLYKAIGDLNSI